MPRHRGRSVWPLAELSEACSGGLRSAPRWLVYAPLDLRWIREQQVLLLPDRKSRWAQAGGWGAILCKQLGAEFGNSHLKPTGGGTAIYNK